MNALGAGDVPCIRCPEDALGGRIESEGGLIHLLFP